MAELLLELFSEEIPARMQARAAEDLKRLVTEKLKEAGLEFARADAYVTPRRLALVVDGLPEHLADQRIERKGPRVGAPDSAIQGFLKSTGRTSLSECEQRDTGKGVFWFAVDLAKGSPITNAVIEPLRESIRELPWPKAMRWASYRARWVRPLRSILAMVDGQDVVLDIDLDSPEFEESLNATAKNELRAGRQTFGHRFLAPAPFFVSSFAEYKSKLRDAKVILDPAERRATIKAQAEQIVRDAGYSIKPDGALLDEVTGLVEWPVLLMGRIDDAFMGIPPEVLTTTMRTNQKYFSLLEKGGRLVPRFLVVANMETADKGKAIVAGNERVLRARLADAKFFWDQDRQVKLETRVPALKDIIFHAKLGTVADKVARLQKLAVELATHIPGADADDVRRAALLAKADLTSGMVGEFPELQGVMGRYYALHDGEKPAVADAIAEHYAPLGPNDRCPTPPISVAVALADKLDTLVGFFTINEKPTGSKDPFALRRAALGVIRLITENKLRLPLLPLLETAQDVVHKHLGRGGMVGSALQEVAGWNRRIDSEILALLDFFADRLKVALREKGVRHDLISAVFALGGEDDLVRLLARVDALKKFLDSDDGANLLVAYRRASNIVRIEEKKDGRSYNGGTEAALLRQDEEKALHQALAASGGTSGKSLQSEDFQGAMAALAQLRRPVDAFFDKVTVNCEEADLRANRLRLLSQIRATLGGVADFSKIEG
jgi:glycyl-tRNA synthetase beta chain